MNNDNRNLKENEIIKISKDVVGKTLKDLGDFKYDLNNPNYKGGVGVLMEENLFHYNANSDSAPDFKDANIELKTTCVKRNKNGTYSAKERLVLNIINYMEEYKHTFYESSFWKKNQKLQILFYLYDENVPKEDYKVIAQILFSYPPSDLLIIKHDWEYIINKIKSGKAHELSEADTMYLGACTKGKDSMSLRKQPFSDIPARQRAFCLKNSYMTSLVREKIFNEKDEKILSSDSTDNFIDFLKEKVKPYIGFTQEEFIKLFDIKGHPKNINEIIISKIFGLKGSIKNSSEFKKANICCKTVRIEKNNTIKEHMSFPPFSFEKIVTEDWESSNLRNYFLENKFLFIIFKSKNGHYYFDGIKLWNIPKAVVDTKIQEVWLETQNVIKSGKIVKSIGKTRKTNFPGSTFNHICHVRPHGSNMHDVYRLPVDDKLTGESYYTKQSFWLDRAYILKSINNKN